MGNRLKLRQDGSFTIVQFTDIHWGDGGSNDLRSAELMMAVLEAEKPDLTVFTGDVIYSSHCKDPKDSFRQAVAVADRYGKPWAAVFGNHDSESGVTREELMDVQMEFANCVSARAPEGVEGTGNFVLELEGEVGKLSHALFFLDSREYSRNRLPGYGTICRSQIDWYEKESIRLETEAGGPIPALAFFHIPLPEYADVWDFHTCYGEKNENVCCPLINSGMFAAMVDRGNVAGTFAGHDHVNDYWGELYGIRLCYGRASGYNTYGKEGFPRGARVIRLSQGESEFETWLRLDTGEAVLQQPVHHPEGRKVSVKNPL